MAWTDFLSKGGDLLLKATDKAIDREFNDGADQIVVNDPTPVKTTENTGAPTQPGVYGTGQVTATPQVLGMPWHQALLVGSVALLGLGVALKVITR